jgi:hypothetical protein
MTAQVVEVPGQGHRAVCEDAGCATTHTGPTYTLVVNWRTWIMTAARAAHLAADHNRSRHGAR